MTRLNSTTLPSRARYLYCSNTLKEGNETNVKLLVNFSSQANFHLFYQTKYH